MVKNCLNLGVFISNYMMPSGKVTVTGFYGVGSICYQFSRALVAEIIRLRS